MSPSGPSKKLVKPEMDLNFSDLIELLICTLHSHTNNVEDLVAKNLNWYIFKTQRLSNFVTSNYR